MKDFNYGYGIRINDNGGSNRIRSRYCNWQEQAADFLIQPFGYSALVRGRKEETENQEPVFFKP